VSKSLQVAPPPKPLMVYDGECAFCVRWIRKWQRATGGHVAYSPYQSRWFKEVYPGIPLERCEQAVQFIAADGSVFSGAEAVLRSLATASRAKRLLAWYERFPWFARFAEWAYGFVARHRGFFSALTRSTKER
jgi:predicted DCC family thiol-disulfide oxidoreductase YuxK